VWYMDAVDSEVDRGWGLEVALYTGLGYRAALYLALAYITLYYITVRLYWSV